MARKWRQFCRELNPTECLVNLATCRTSKARPQHQPFPLFMSHRNNLRLCGNPVVHFVPCLPVRKLPLVSIMPLIWPTARGRNERLCPTRGFETTRYANPRGPRLLSRQANRTTAPLLFGAGVGRQARRPARQRRNRRTSNVYSVTRQSITSGNFLRRRSDRLSGNRCHIARHADTYRPRRLMGRIAAGMNSHT